VAEVDASGIGLTEQALLVTTDFDEMEFVGTGPLSIGMPFDAPQEFKSMLLAAATCYLWGNSSVDHVLRRYPEMLERARPSEEERQLQQTLRAALNAASDVRQKAKSAHAVDGLDQALSQLRADF